MAAAVQKHEENAIKLAEVASELSKPPNLRSDSSTDSVPQSSQKSNILASALFTRKGKDKKKSSNKSKKDQKLDHLKREVQQAKQSEEAELQNSESAEAVTEPGTNDDQVIDIADDLLKQLDEKEEATPTPQSKDAEPAAAAATGAGPEISKVPSARSTSTSTSASTTSADSGVSDSTARSSGTSRLSNLFSKKGRQKARVASLHLLSINGCCHHVDGHFMCRSAAKRKCKLSEKQLREKSTPPTAGTAVTRSNGSGRVSCPSVDLSTLKWWR